jgi:hypothetical protein
MLRCAKTLVKKHLGILYDRHNDNPDDTSVIQGLVGRNTGYDDNGISICYTNIKSIEKYEALWISKFEDKRVKWVSKTTRYKKGEIGAKNTFNDPKNYEGFNQDEEIKETEPTIQKFETQE